MNGLTRTFSIFICILFAVTTPALGSAASDQNEVAPVSEVWSCGDFTASGKIALSYVEFYPFGTKIGNMKKIVKGDRVFINFRGNFGGDKYIYVLKREDGAPVRWKLKDNGVTINKTILFASCNYNTS